MRTRDELHEYWRNPEEKNSPKMYIDHAYRTEYLVGLVSRFAGRDEEILEVGSNVGRNLNGLYAAGYKRLKGIEINWEAVDLMVKTYPQLKTDMYLGSVESWADIFTKYPRDHDLIFTMCVLMHIHPDSEGVFEVISHRAKKHIITIEDEVKETWRHCPRNYKDVFEPFGFVQVFEETVLWGENGCVARVMKRVEAD